MDRIRELRAAKGVSQATLAVTAGMDPATLNRLEQGKANPNLKTLEKLADALEVEVPELFSKKVSAPLQLQLQEPAGLSNGWVQAYANVGQELLRGWEKRDQKWGHILQAFVNSLPEERRVEARFPRVLLNEYSDWILDTGIVINTYVEGVLGKQVAGLEPDLDQVCDRMIRLWRRISAHSQALLHSAAGEDDPEVARFREQLKAQDAPDFEARYREAAGTQEPR